MKSVNTKRMGYLGILVSYLILLTSFILFAYVLKNPNKFIIAICLTCGMLLLFLSIHLTEKGKNESENKIDKSLKFLCFLPLYIILLPLALVALVFILIDSVKNSFSKQTKPLRKMGFSLSINKQNKVIVYFLKKEACVIKIIPNNLYQISFNNGETFANISDTKLGTIEERKELKDIIEKYNGCDYRDRDMYAPTRYYISFLTKNLP